MNLEVNGHNIILIVLVTFLTSVLLTPFIIKAADHIGAMDIPNERKVHKKPIPRLGGLAIFGAFLLGYMLFARTSNQMLSILIGGFLVVLVGIFDDVKPVPAKIKFIVQVLAAAVVVFYGRIFFGRITFLGLDFTFPVPLNYLFTILFMVGTMNAINLIDGLDGLASGISSIYFATIAIIAFILNKMQGLDTILALIMLGSTLGFLVWNFNPAKIFMGDTGSLFLGFTISVISLLGFKGATLTSFIIPIVILSIPIFDTGLAILRRILKGEKISAPDKEHFHHQLLKMKFSMKATVLIIYAINILFASVSIFFVLGDAKMAVLIYVILMLLVLFLVMKTDILFQHKKKDS
ncbi:MAG: undecaprenyl/decaprenyl-phosphate alpha-N-acetylglucosaminyl 1-phosphate transferase [Bacilli bacterium]|jgi:UDP-GlcNAc:undecaprenyl-phosphate GlcNAc-1-phosphate transferase|nr:undecaprenyl/decaprenyl-phosphate alpha-N-acetylglucosaminyl 1-phosphate transferase [Bacilli bacterium]